ncbi:hypothetical protein Ndes2526B_g04816 [Nannochloris sp. 'desiccata']
MILLLDHPSFAPRQMVSAVSASAATIDIVTGVKFAVGDFIAIKLKFYSLLPPSVALQDVKLLLLGLQEMAALASPCAPSPSQSTALRPSMQNMPLASAWNSTQHGTWK